MIRDFDGFYREHLRLVYAMALSRAVEPTEAEDLAQETFLRAWRHFEQLSALPCMAQRAWLIRSVRNLATDAWRRRQMEARERTRDAAPLDSGPPSVLRLDVARALQTLGETEREIVILRYFLEMNSREIAGILATPEGTVRRKLLECRGRLAEALRPWQREADHG